jgi:hypothetical protein
LTISPAYSSRKKYGGRLGGCWPAAEAWSGRDMLALKPGDGGAGEWEEALFCCSVGDGKGGGTWPPPCSWELGLLLFDRLRPWRLVDGLVKIVERRSGETEVHRRIQGWDQRRRHVRGAVQLAEANEGRTAGCGKFQWRDMSSGMVFKACCRLATQGSGMRNRAKLTRWKRTRPWLAAAGAGRTGSERGARRETQIDQRTSMCR